MKTLVLHELTRRQLEDFQKSPAHAIMLAGPVGSGKDTLSRHVSELILGLRPGSLDNYPYKMIVEPAEGKAIGIEAIRQIESFLSLKVPGADPARPHRVIIVGDAHLMTAEAQNAFLKTLEEPPAGTVIILNSGNEQALLPTIRSRVQAIGVKRPNRTAIEGHFKAAGFDGPAVKRAYSISGGLPGLMQALLEEAEHPLTEATQKARQLLSQPAYERLLLVDELSRQRQLALDTLFILQQMAHVSLQTATGKAAAKWQAVLTASYQASQALTVNAQSKLVLTNLMLSF